MRSERTDDPHLQKCWLTSDEYADLCRTLSPETFIHLQR
jgi:hypothetical protein